MSICKKTLMALRSLLLLLLQLLHAPLSSCTSRSTIIDCKDLVRRSRGLSEEIEWNWWERDVGRRSTLFGAPGKVSTRHDGRCMLWGPLAFSRCRRISGARYTAGVWPPRRCPTTTPGGAWLPTSSTRCLTCFPYNKRDNFVINASANSCMHYHQPPLSLSTCKHNNSSPPP